MDTQEVQEFLSAHRKQINAEMTAMAQRVDHMWNWARNMGMAIAHPQYGDATDAQETAAEAPRAEVKSSGYDPRRDGNPSLDD